jgi:hypothetical protein
MIKSSMVAAIQAAGTLPILLLELFYAGEVNDSRIKIGANSADTIQRRPESAALTASPSRAAGGGDKSRRLNNLGPDRRK